MTGIVARLHAATRGPQPPGILHTLTHEDAVELDRIIADLCPDERLCYVCDARLCETCEVGQPTRCLLDPCRVHCDTCRHDCIGCQEFLRRESWPR